MERRSTSAATLLAALFFCSFAHRQDNPFSKIGEIRLAERLAAKGESPLGHMSISVLSFSPDGTRLAIAILDAANRDVLRVAA